MGKLINPIEFVTPPKNNVTIEIVEESKKDDNILDFSMSKFLEGGDEIRVENVEVTPVVNKPRSKTIKTKNIGGNDVVVNEDDSDSSTGLKHFQTDEPYQDTYTESMMGLDVAIKQLDELSMSIRGDLEELRSSKTIKSRHKNISEMASTLSAIINTKIGAIKEKNSVIGKSHDLELKRIKDLNLNATNEVDHDRAIMDTYNAFISMPGGGGNYMPPTMGIITDPPGYQFGNNIINTAIGNADEGFAAYKSNITPAQNRMRYEDNPNVQTVVLYNRNTGERDFDIVDISTGQSIPNIQRPDRMFLEDTTIDINNRVARNANIDQTYPLIEISESLKKY